SRGGPGHSPDDATSVGVAQSPVRLHRLLEVCIPGDRGLNDPETPPVARIADAMTSRDDLLERARSLLARAPVVDGHNDLLWEARERFGYDFDRLDISSPCPEVMTDIPRIREGRLGGQFWSVYVPSDLPGDTAVTATLEQIDALYAMVRRYPEVFELARTADDVERVTAAGRIASRSEEHTSELQSR